MSQAPRHDIYGPVHKAIRASLADLMVRLGRTDFACGQAASEMLAALRAQLRFSAAHLEHEDLHIHPALLARAPEAVDKLEHEHEEHQAGFDGLERLIAEVEAAPAAERGAAGRRLYLAFTGFVAHDLEHMAQEEQIVGPLLQSLFTDAELQAMEAAIVGSMPPEEAMAAVALMIPAMNPVERAAFLSFVRDTAPPEAFGAMVAVAARPNLPANDWIDLAARLGLAA
jgi:iron-sulfur cluster repair protein YtfE (RIC family)